MHLSHSHYKLDYVEKINFGFSLLLWSCSAERSQTLGAALWSVYQIDGERVLMCWWGKKKKRSIRAVALNHKKSSLFLLREKLQEILTWFSISVLERFSFWAGSVKSQENCFVLMPRGTRLLGGTGGGALPGPSGKHALGSLVLGGSGGGRTGIGLSVLSVFPGGWGSVGIMSPEKEASYMCASSWGKFPRDS